MRRCPPPGQSGPVTGYLGRVDVVRERQPCAWFRRCTHRSVPWSRVLVEGVLKHRIEAICDEFPRKAAAA